MAATVACSRIRSGGAASGSRGPATWRACARPHVSSGVVPRPDSTSRAYSRHASRPRQPGRPCRRRWDRWSIEVELRFQRAASSAAASGTPRRGRRWRRPAVVDQLDVQGRGSRGVTCAIGLSARPEPCVGRAAYGSGPGGIDTAQPPVTSGGGEAGFNGQPRKCTRSRASRQPRSADQPWPPAARSSTKRHTPPPATPHRAAAAGRRDGRWRRSPPRSGRGSLAAALQHRQLPARQRLQGGGPSATTRRGRTASISRSSSGR